MFTRTVLRSRYFELKSFQIKNYQYSSSSSNNNMHKIINLDIDNNKINHFAEFRKFVKNKNLYHKDGPTCMQIRCRLCNHPDKNLAYVNKCTGTFICPKCDIKLSVGQARDYYENNKKVQTTEINSSTYKACEEYSDITQDITDMLGIKGLKFNDLINMSAQYVPSTNSLHFPLHNVVQEKVGEKIYNLTDKTEQTLQTPNCSGLLSFGQKQQTKAIIVTNLLDFIILSMQKLDNHCVICLPYFLKTMPHECLPVLEKYKELILWFKFDSAGWDAAKSFSQKMNEKRCLFIRPTETEPTPFEAHKKRLNIKHILQKSMPVTHKAITTFNALRNDVLSDLQNIEKVNGVKWKRFPILSKLLKGHRRGELTIITGPTGSGKTTFVSEYSLDLALQGVSTLFGSFEIRNSRLASTLLRQYVGYSLETKLNEFEHWANEFEKFPIYFMTFHGQQPIKDVMEAIQHAHYVHDINHVIIDNLQFMMGISVNYKTDKFSEQDAIIAAFRSFATKQNVHVTLVVHPRKEREESDLTVSSVFGTAKATQEADNVLIIQDKRLTSLRGKKYLQIAKNRYTGDLGIMPMDFDKESLSYASSNTKKKKKIE